MIIESTITINLTLFLLGVFCGLGTHHKTDLVTLGELEGSNGTIFTNVRSAISKIKQRERAMFGNSIIL